MKRRKKRSKKRPEKRPEKRDKKPIPEYLKHYMARQNYAAYTAIDHASWRYIMRVSRAFFKDHAHQKYLTGLKETGITIERIPRMTEMNKKLKKFGWRVATVTGFIPPSIFLEFLSLNILPIACDMRRLEHLEYTPAPDIVHEAAGHAPIISDPRYAAYLNRFGEIARKAIFAKEDLDVYEAIKELSEVKESAKSTAEQIEAADKKLQETLKTVTYTSEATKLARLGWWSTEYGLIRQDKFKIYGAGLLSSVGESHSCFSDEVKKIPLDIDCVDVSYDITKPQPQLFYVENFKQLEAVIDKLALQLAYKIGGLEGLARAKRSELVNTVELESGLQISGKLTGVETNGQMPIYLQFMGPVQLSLADQQLPGHSAKYHAPGYGTPLGKIKGLNKTAAQLTARDLAKLGFSAGSRSSKRGRLEYESGVIVEGVLKRILRRRGRNLVLTFRDCRVFRPAISPVHLPPQQERVFFAPEWGAFDLGCGENVVSVFGGAADRKRYLKDTHPERPKIRSQNSTVTRENRELIPLYARVRKLREGKLRHAGKRKATSNAVTEAKKVFDRLHEKFPHDWLLRLELLELLSSKSQLTDQLRTELVELSAGKPTLKALIRRGLELL